MKKSIGFLLLVLAFFSGNAQWSAVNSGTVNNLNNLQMISLSTGYMTASDGIYVTNDGGLQWSKLSYFQPDSTFYITVGAYSLCFTNSTTGVVVGYSYIDNAAVIIRTTNGGTVWSTSYVGEANINFNDVWFVNANTGFAVGENGAIVTSTDGGINWSPVASGVSNNLQKVRFDPVNANYGLICGDSIMLRTTDGGQSWSTIIFSGQLLNTIDFAAPGIAYSTSNVYALLKTTDDGATWDSVTTTMPGANDIFFTSADTGYSCSDQIYRTLDGGLVCDQQIPLSGFNFLYFYNSQVGFCGGYGGELFRTSNAGGIGWKPIAHIVLNGSYTCTDSLYNFQTISNAGYSYRWTLNGQLLSTQASDSAVMHGNNSNDTLTVVVSNGLSSDTVSTVFYAFGPSGFRLLPLYATDTLCNGGYGFITTDSTYGGAYYQLFADTTPEGNLIQGTGNNMSFSIAGLPGNTFTVKAYNFDGCNAAPLAETVTVVPIPPPVPVFTATPADICYAERDTVRIEVNNTQYGTTYNLFEPQYDTPETTGIGTGGTIYLTFTGLGATDSFDVQTISSHSCYNFYSDVATVVVRKLDVDFSRAEDVLVGQDIEIQNLSNGDHYLWTFDSSANVLTDTFFQPEPVYYNTTGLKLVKLRITTDTGSCLDTFQFRERVSLPIDTQAPGQVCTFDTVYSLGNDYNQIPAYTLAYHVDRFGNQYVAGFTNYNQNGGYNNSSYYYYLQKFDRNNNLIWQKTQSPSTYDTIGDGGLSYYSAYITGISTDPQGNVYVCGTYGAAYFIFDTAHVYPNPANWPFHSYPNFYVAKFDTAGALQWLTHSSNDATTGSYMGATDILYEDAQHIYVPVFSDMYVDSLVGPDGAAFGIPNSTAFLLQINSDGKYMHQFNIGNGGPFSDNNSGAYNPYEAALDYGWVTTVSPRMHLASDGKIVLLGQFINKLTFGNNILYDTMQTGLSGYVAVLDTTLGWVNATTTFTNGSYGYGIAGVKGGLQLPVSCLDKNNNLYMVAQAPFTVPNQPGRALPDAGVYEDSLPAAYVLKYNASGKLLWVAGSYEDNIKGIAVNDNSDTVYMFGDYKPFFSFDSMASTLPAGRVSQGGSDAFIAALDSSGNFGWFQNIGSDTIDGALFMERNCGGVLNCLGYTAGAASVKNSTLNNNQVRDFILHYDPTANNCQAQLCPAEMNIYSYVYDTFTTIDTVYAAFDTLTQINITIYCDTNSIDSTYFPDTVITVTFLGQIDTLNYPSSYQTYDTALALTYNHYFDSVVYLGLSQLKIDTFYDDTLVISKTVKQTTGIETLNMEGLKLSVYPNPFNSATNISYFLPEDVVVNIALYDNLGRKVKSLFDGEQGNGDYKFIISASGLSAGVYQLMFTAGDKTIMQKLVYLSRE